MPSFFRQNLIIYTEHLLALLLGSVRLFWLQVASSKTLRSLHLPVTSGCWYFSTYASQQHNHSGCSAPVAFSNIQSQEEEASGTKSRTKVGITVHNMWQGLSQRQLDFFKVSEHESSLLRLSCEPVGEIRQAHQSVLFTIYMEELIVVCHQILFPAVCFTRDAVIYPGRHMLTKHSFNVATAPDRTYLSSSQTQTEVSPPAMPRSCLRRWSKTWRLRHT